MTRTEYGFTVKETSELPDECGGGVIVQEPGGRRWILTEPLTEGDSTPTPARADVEQWRAYVGRMLADGEMVTVNMLAERFDLDHPTALKAFKWHRVLPNLTPEQVAARALTA